MVNIIDLLGGDLKVASDYVGIMPLLQVVFGNNEGNYDMSLILFKRRTRVLRLSKIVSSWVSFYYSASTHESEKT